MFRIAPHFRLQEWVAEEKGYFKAEGLDYEFRDSWGKDDPGKTHVVPDKFGAYQTFEKGREEGVSCACHWTVNAAAAQGPGERIVFESYTRESFDDSQRWIAEHGIFENGKVGAGRYEESVVTLAA